jgi:hypothetical protein
MNSMANDDDLNEASNTLKTISDTFEDIFHFDLYFFNDLIYSQVEANEIYDHIKNGLANAKQVIFNITSKLDIKDVDETIRKRLYEIGSTKEHLKFENNVLKWLRNKLIDLKGKVPLDIFKNWIKKIFKAINIIIDSLKKACSQLEAVKEFKEMMENLFLGKV